MFATHFNFGMISLLTLASIYLTIKSDKNEIERYQKIGLYLFQVNLISGLLLELVEPYPNPLINTHLLFGFGCYAIFFLAFLALKKSAKATMALNILGLTLLFYTAHLGGLIHKGTGFIWL